jgi:hypothetical protein
MSKIDTTPLAPGLRDPDKRLKLFEATAMLWNALSDRLWCGGIVPNESGNKIHVIVKSEYSALAAEEDLVSTGAFEDSAFRGIPVLLTRAVSETTEKFLDRNMQYFRFKHLPPHLREVSKKFAELAIYINDNLPCNEQQTLALQLLVQAKDAAVRSRLDVHPIDGLRAELEDKGQDIRKAGPHGDSE